MDSKVSESLLASAWQLTLDAIPDPIALIDTEYKIVKVNRALAERLGKDADACEGERCCQLLYGHEDPHQECPHTRLLEDGNAHREEVFWQRVGGEYLVTVSPLYGLRGELLGCVHVGHEITERKVAEKRRGVLSRILEAVFETHDLKELIRSIHEALGTLLDVGNFYVATYDDTSGLYSFPYYVDEHDSLDDFDHPDALAGSLTDYVRRSCMPLLLKPEIEDNLRRRGEIGEVIGPPAQSWVGIPLVDNQGRAFGVTVVQSYTDSRCYSQEDLDLLVMASSQIAVAVERKQAEETLRESESRLRSVFRAAPVGIGLVSNRILKEVNEQLCEMTGYLPDELLEKSARLLYPSEEEFLFVGEEKYRQISEHGTGTVETKWKTKDGTIIDVILSSTPLDMEDWARGVTFTAMDITDRKRAEEDRLEFQRQLQHAQKLESLDVLAGGIAHDFNNLLVGILGNADIALLELPSSSPARANIEGIEKTAVRAAELCRQMLAYSGKGRFVVDPIDLSQLVEEMVHLLRASISKKADLELLLADDLPAVEADSTQLRQVVMNLMTNASEAIGDEGGRIVVSTGVMNCDAEFLSPSLNAGSIPTGDYIYLEVADSGCGMDEATRSRIFDPFFTTKFSGRGLGLAAVQGIVHSHGGAIHVDSRVGRGTTIQVLFPASHRDPMGSRGYEAATPQPWTGHGKVLLVDDDESVRIVTVQMLEQLGFEVEEACDGREAIEYLTDHADEVVLVLLDMTMPHMDGRETLQEMERLGLSTPVVLSSGHDEQATTGQLVSRGLAGFIQKPYRLGDLREKVRSILEGSTTSNQESAEVDGIILVVDDDEDLLILTAQNLKRLGHSTRTAQSGEEALEIVREHGAMIDIVLLDISMPGMGGPEVLPLLKDASPLTKVVFFTGHGTDSRTQGLLDLGADGVFEKTVSRERLAELIRHVLES
jgi:PAS domain S-box-containing protein